MSNIFRHALNKASAGIKLSFNANFGPRSAGGILQNDVVSNWNSGSQKYSTAPAEYEIVPSNQGKILSKEIINKVNEQVAKNEQGRLFAVIHVAGKQFKVTEGDLIVIEGYWPPSTGDKISFDKVMVAGGINFSLIGTPLVERGLVNVTGTVIEKTLSHTKTHFRKKRRKQYMRINFFRVQQTVVRINEVKLVGELNNPPEVCQGPIRAM